MVTIPNKDWTDFVAAVHARLATIDANIEGMKAANATQHQNMATDIFELKEMLNGKDPGSMTNRVRSLEDSRTKVSGMQLGLSAAFSVVTSTVAFMFSQHMIHVSWEFLSTKVIAVCEAITGFFRRN